MYKHTHISRSNNARGSACTEVSTEIMGVQGSTCLYISTEGMGAYGVTYTDDSMVNTAVRGRTDAYDKYGRYKPKWDIGTDVVGKICNGISYADAL